MPSAWSCLGLVACFEGDSLTIIDPNLPFCDPNYASKLEFDANEQGTVQSVLWNSVGSHLMVVTELNFILIYSQQVIVSSEKRTRNFNNLFRNRPV